jgi:hypothetical protein
MANKKFPSDFVEVNQVTNDDYLMISALNADAKRIKANKFVASVPASSPSLSIVAARYGLPVNPVDGYYLIANPLCQCVLSKIYSGGGTIQMSPPPAGRKYWVYLSDNFNKITNVYTYQSKSNTNQRISIFTVPNNLIPSYIKKEYTDYKFLMKCESGVWTTETKIPYGEYYIKTDPKTKYVYNTHLKVFRKQLRYIDWDINYLFDETKMTFNFRLQFDIRYRYWHKFKFHDGNVKHSNTESFYRRLSFENNNLLIIKLYRHFPYIIRNRLGDGKERFKIYVDYIVKPKDSRYKIKKFRVWYHVDYTSTPWNLNARLVREE